LPPEFKFTSVGIGDKDGTVPFEFKEDKLDISVTHRFGRAGKMLELPVKRLSTLMYERGHNHIDILKMDIESAEYDVIPDIVGLDIRQILVETHQRFFVGWKGLKPLYGKWKAHTFFRTLVNAGFKVAHAQPIADGSIDKDYLLLKR
jgi:hypothetical protein